MSPSHRRWPFAARRCVRCTRSAVVVVVDEHAPEGTVAACREHLEWAFLAGVDEWSARRPTT